MDLNKCNRPTEIIPYWGGSVSIWTNGEGEDMSVRSLFHPDQFFEMIQGLVSREGGNGPGREGYWWFPHGSKDTVMEALRAWAISTEADDWVSTFDWLKAPVAA